MTTRQAVDAQASVAVDTPATSDPLWFYMLLGTVLGVVFTRTEVISWFRIQEMFRFGSFHMFGVIGSAVAVGALGLWIVRRMDGPDATPHPSWKVESPGPQHIMGGTAFGLGWGLLGACPGPVYTLIGNGVTVMIVALASALVGVWTYGRLRDRLPHR